MAIYTYRCTKCEYERQIQHKDNTKPHVRCDRCGHSMIRVILQHKIDRVTK